MSKVLYNDSYCIGIEELNKIYLSLLTSADCIYINQNVEVDWQLPTEIYKHIKKSLASLHEHGLIKYWAFPYVAAPNAPEIVLDKYEYNMWDDMINQTYFNRDSMHSIFNYLGDGNTRLPSTEENTSKILLIRREYWTYAILAMLRADKVLNYFPEWMPDQNKIPNLTAGRIEDIAAKHIFSHSSSSVFALESSDVISLHKKNEKLRNQLNEKAENLATVQTSLFNSLLQEAIAANAELIKQEKWGAIDNGINLSVTLTGVAVNLTPAGFIFSQLQTAKDIGQGMFNALGALYGGDKEKNLFYILIKMNNRLNRKLKKLNTDSILFSSQK